MQEGDVKVKNNFPESFLPLLQNTDSKIKEKLKVWKTFLLKNHVTSHIVMPPKY